MPEEPFKNREIIEMFDDLSRGQERIEQQVKITNGRVTALERWKYVGMGATSILSLMIVPLLAWALTILVNMDARIQQSVDRALSVYEISLK